MTICEVDLYVACSTDLRGVGERRDGMVLVLGQVPPTWLTN